MYDLICFHGISTGMSNDVCYRHELGIRPGMATVRTRLARAKSVHSCTDPVQTTIAVSSVGDD